MLDNCSLAPNPVSASSIEVSTTENDDVNVTWEVRMYCYQFKQFYIIIQAPEVNACLMTSINRYVINIDFRTGINVSVESNTTSVIYEDLEDLPNVTDVTITIIVFNIKGMSSRSTSRNFGMKIHTYMHT